jgi:hypothetical protein
VAQALCFVLPPVVKTVQVSAPRETLLVSAYSRPSNLVKRVQVPEDYAAFNALTPGQPSWFTVRPADHVQRREAGQASVLRIQAPLPEDDPLILVGEYEWDSFLPDGNAIGHMLLLPPAVGPPLRADSLPFTYYPVLVGPAQRLCLLGQPWEPQVEPTLILACADGVPGPTDVSLDGKSIFSNHLDAPIACLRLGNLKVGEHDLIIHAGSPVSAYLNYLESAGPPAFLQRFCVMTSSNVLSFPYVKRQPGIEGLVLRVFSSQETTCSPSFKVHLKLKTVAPRGVGPFTDLTFLEREAQVTPGPMLQNSLIADGPTSLDAGQPVFFPIGSDLPPGDYKVEVTVAAATPHWLSLSRTTPGLSEKLNLTLQRPLY